MRWFNWRKLPALVGYYLSACGKSVRREQRSRQALLVLCSSTRACLTHRALLALASAQKRTKKIDFTSAANWLIEFHQRIEWVFSFKFKVSLLSHLSLNIITLFYHPLSLSLWFTKLTTWRMSPPRIKLEYEWARRNMSSTPRPRARNGNTLEKTSIHVTHQQLL